MTMLPLSLTELTISYGRTKIFDELTHAFPTGCHVIAGPNGAGKSTLLGAVCGVIPYRGRISIAGHDLKRNFIDARRNLAFVPDAATFYPFVTGEEYARLVARAHGQGEAVCARDLHTSSTASTSNPTSARRSARRRSAPARNSCIWLHC